MNLDDLCAIKVMGWEKSAPEGIPGGYRPKNMFDRQDGRGFQSLDEMGWHPSTSLDDAMVCLERAAQGKGYSIYMFPEEKKPYDVELEVYKVCTDAKTLPLAMCLCSLRAMGVPESEIQEAMK